MQGQRCRVERVAHSQPRRSRSSLWGGDGGLCSIYLYLPWDHGEWGDQTREILTRNALQSVSVLYIHNLHQTSEAWTPTVLMLLP